MSKFNDSNGGPAFPQPHLDMGGASGAVSADEMGAGGMSLRDYFAAKAMQAAMTGAQGIGSATDDIRAEAWKAVSRISYEIADAMLLARKQP